MLTARTARANPSVTCRTSCSLSVANSAASRVAPTCGHRAWLRHAGRSRDAVLLDGRSCRSTGRCCRRLMTSLSGPINDQDLRVVAPVLRPSDVVLKSIVDVGLATRFPFRKSWAAYLKSCSRPQMSDQSYGGGAQGRWWWPLGGAAGGDGSQDGGGREVVVVVYVGHR